MKKIEFRGVKEIKRSLNYIRVPKIKMFIILILKISEIVISIIQPILWGYMLQSVLKINVNEFVRDILLLLFLYIIESIVIYFETYIGTAVNEKIVCKTKRDLFDKIMNYPMLFIDKMGCGELLSHLEGDVATIIDVFTGQLVNVVVSVLKAVIISVVAFSISWPLAILTVMSFPISYFVIDKFGNILQKDQVKLRDAMDIYYNKTQEFFLGISCIKVFGAKKIASQKFTSLVNNNKNIGIHMGKMTAISSGIVGILNFSTQIAVYGLGMFLLIKKRLIFPHFVAFSAYTASLTEALLDITQINPRLKQAIVSVKRINELFFSIDNSQEEWGHSRIPEFIDEIGFKKVNFSYGNKEILKNITLKFEQGKKYAIVGSSGAGKSTLLKLLVKLYEVETGKITINEININNFIEGDFRKVIGIVQQEPILFGMSIYENIKLGNALASVNDVYNAAKKANIFGDISHLQNGFHTVINSKGDNLSLGQKQRIALARTLLQDPKIILFDEVTSALDNKSQMMINKAINSLKGTHTLILISHKIANVIDADQIIVMEDGKVVDVGTHFELLEKCLVYKQLFDIEKNISHV